VFSFRRLRWKLTASYTLVTVATMLAIELLVLFAGLLVLRGVLDELPKTITSEMTTRLAPEVGAYLGGEAPDLEGVHRWLTNVGTVRISGGEGDEPDVSFDFVDLVGEDTRLMVLDREGRQLGVTRQEAAPAEPLPLDPATVPGLSEVLPAALAGESRRWLHDDSTGAEHLTVAVPVRSVSGAVVGALVLSGPYSPTQVFAVGWAVAIVLIVFGVIAIALLAGLIGTVFGFFTARGLTRRLDRVTATAVAWGQGDFSRTIEDRSADEIGRLGRHLNRMAVQLEDLIAARQELSALNERNRLARDLHDSVKQQMFAVSMNLGVAEMLWDQDPPAARDRLNAVRDLVRQSQQELTTIIQALRPAPLEDKGLRLALAEHVERWQEQTGITAVFEADVDRALPLPVEEALFRIGQEALSNVARHSGATRVLVTLAARNGEASLSVNDNGRGFDRGRRRPGVGLRSMRERAAALGGEVNIKSGVAGTSVMARVPVSDGAPT
jgi:NarL family two-component system sensor histidine kinase LiaS